MINFDQLFRMVQSLNDIQLSMFGATREQRRGVQACWDGVFKYMNELMKPFLVWQTGFWNRGEQIPVAPTMARQPQDSATPPPAPTRTPRVRTNVPFTPAAKAQPEHNTPEPPLTSDAGSRVRAAKKAKASATTGASRTRQARAGEPVKPGASVAQASPSPAQPPRKPAPAGRAKPIKAKSSVTPSGKSRSLSLKRLSGTRRPGKKLRRR